MVALNKIFSRDTYAPYMPTRDQVKKSADKICAVSENAFVMIGALMAASIVFPAAFFVIPPFSIATSIYIVSYKKELIALLQDPRVKKAAYTFFLMQKGGGIGLGISSTIYTLSSLTWHECVRREKQNSFSQYYLRSAS